MDTAQSAGLSLSFSGSIPGHRFGCRNSGLELVVPAVSKFFGRQRHIDVGFDTLAFDNRAAPVYQPAAGNRSTNPWPTEKLPPPSTWPPVRVPTILANPFSAANAATISPALNVCSLTSMTIRPWNGFGPKPSVMRRIERSRCRTRNRTAIRRVSNFVSGSLSMQAS